MTFFEPIEPISRPVGPYGPTWAPPVWDRPSEGVAPAVVPVNEVLGRSADAALILQSLSVYPNGLVLDVLVMRSPRDPLDHDHSHPFMNPERWPRVGVEYSDGRRAGGKAAWMPGPMQMPKDDQGIPIEPVLMPRGGGGGSTEHHMGFWLYPLPDEGPLRVYATWPAIGLEETAVELDGDAIRDAASRAIVLWD